MKILIVCFLWKFSFIFTLIKIIFHSLNILMLKDLSIKTRWCVWAISNLILYVEMNDCLRQQDIWPLQWLQVFPENDYQIDTVSREKQ